MCWGRTRLRHDDNRTLLRTRYGWRPRRCARPGGRGVQRQFLHGGGEAGDAYDDAIGGDHRGSVLGCRRSYEQVHTPVRVRCVRHPRGLCVALWSSGRNYFVCAGDRRGRLWDVEIVAMSIVPTYLWTHRWLGLRSQD